MCIGFFTKIQMSKIVFTIKQTIALTLFGIGIVFIVDRIDIDSVYKLSIVMVSGLLLPNIVSVLISTGQNNEKKISKKIEKKIDKYL